jgi:hypothetical protein
MSLPKQKRVVEVGGAGDDDGRVAELALCLQTQKAPHPCRDTAECG